MTAILTVIQYICTAIGFLVIFCFALGLFLLAWWLIAMRQVVRDEEARFRGQLRSQFNQLNQEDFDRVYREYWNQLNQAKKPGQTK